MDESILYTLGGIFIFSWLFQLFYQLFFLLKPSHFKPLTYDNKQRPLSVIICAKNEASNLKNFIPKICNQNYPNFEVIVVNDCSTDDSEMVLAQLKTEFSNLYYTSIPLSKQHYQGKKLALTIGIKAANNEHLVFTDADCYPTSDQWLKEVSSQFTDEKQIVIGHGRFEKQKSFFNLFLRYETFFNAVQYMGFALRGKPFMAVGRNMAYTKSLFEQSDVFKPYLNMASGDDDLFIRRCANKHNTTIQLNYDSQTVSLAPQSFSEWRTRKSRHLTTAPAYRFGIKCWLIMEPLTRQIMWLLTLCSLFFHIFVPLTIALFALRMLTLHIVLAKAANKMGENKLFWATSIFDFITPWLVGSVWVINIFSAKKKKWK
ncbi:glycosyltransferase [Carboxylicivirga sediminis]|uniref:Glycosyltransferase n=1 Tax=Carboxylicivirga sediminis TaxID=2006564 RepID=A0A941F3A6_9BACT|nr:glycosyltransferase [Carboxylicivirga sediminis]MBR8536001.1 glycosyltransferase [Carboxylicivirga sediminis]